MLGAAACCLAALPVAAGDIACEVNQGPCRTTIKETTVTLDITPRPVTAMRESTFTVTLTGPRPDQAPFVDLGMPAMSMGPNRVKLSQAGLGVYTGTGVIVRCASGKRTWFARVVLPDVGEARFVFDVAY